MISMNRVAGRFLFGDHDAVQGNLLSPDAAKTNASSHVRS
jgi:hypothetical protein